MTSSSMPSVLMKPERQAYVFCARRSSALGRSPRRESPIDGRDLARREISFLGSFAYIEDEFVKAVHTVGLVDERWVEAVPLDESDSVFRRLMESPGAAVRTALVSSS